MCSYVLALLSRSLRLKRIKKPKKNIQACFRAQAHIHTRTLASGWHKCTNEALAHSLTKSMCVQCICVASLTRYIVVASSSVHIIQNRAMWIAYCLSSFAFMRCISSLSCLFVYFSRTLYFLTMQTQGKAQRTGKYAYTKQTAEM